MQTSIITCGPDHIQSLTRTTTCHKFLRIWNTDSTSNTQLLNRSYLDLELKPTKCLDLVTWKLISFVGITNELWNVLICQFIGYHSFTISIKLVRHFLTFILPNDRWRPPNRWKVSHKSPKLWWLTKDKSSQFLRAFDRFWQSTK